MPDPIESTPAPPPVPPSQPSGKSTSTGLPSNIAAALACIPLIGGIIFYLLEKNDHFVRFYAMQSIILGGAWFLFNIAWRVLTAILVAIPGIGWVFAMVLGLLGALCDLAFLVIFIITVVKAFTGVRWEIPYIGPVASKQTDGAA